MIETIENKVLSMEFNGVWDLIEFIDEHRLPTRKEMRKAIGNTVFSMRETRSSDPWGGTNTWKQADKLARHGWQERANKIRTKAAALYAEVMDEFPSKFVPTISDVGDEVDVVRYLSNEYEHMIAYPLVEDRGVLRHVKICVMGNYLGDFHEATNRGIAIATLIDVLEQNGFSAEVDLVFNSSVDSCVPEFSTHRMILPLKKAGDMMEISSMAYWLAHKSAFRRHGFAVREITDLQKGSRICSDYGRSENVPKSFQENYNLYFPTPRKNSEFATPRVAFFNMLMVAQEQGYLPHIENTK